MKAPWITDSRLRRFGRDGIRRQSLLQPCLRLVEHRKQRRGVARLRARCAGEASEGRDTDDTRRIQRNPLDFAHHRSGPRQRRGAWQLRRDDDVTAILCRNEALRGGGEQPAGAADQREIDHKHHHRMPDHEVGGGRVAMRQAIEDAVEQRGEAIPAARDDVPARRRTFLLVRSKDLRGQCRRQRQRAEAGDRGRDRDGDGELLEELSGNATQEGCRHEHRAEHQRDRDQRAADLLHGLERRLAPAHTELEMSLDILDNHDGVVDHDADREDQTEQRQIIDRESERGHHREGADQRHRDRDDRDDRRPPPLQEHQHNDDDERHRLVDRLDQLMDRLGDEFGGVVADIVVEPLREARLELRHRVGDVLCGGERVRSGPLRHHHRDGRLAQQEAVGGVGQRAELDAGDVAQPRGAAVGAGLHHDVLELPDDLSGGQ